MPRLGEATEPSLIERVEPWWRPVAALDRGQSAHSSAGLGAVQGPKQA